MSVELATAYVSIVPSFKGVQGNIAAGLSDPLSKAGDQAGDDAGKSFAQKFQDKFKSIGGGLTASLVAAGGLAAAGFTAAFGQYASAGTLQAKLGIGPDEAKTLAKTSGKIYASNWGESLDEVNGAVATVKQGLGDLVKDSDLEDLTTKALAFQQTFGVETAESIKAVSQMLKTGMAKNATEAFDILTTGEQTGVDKAGDLIDTFNEYGTQFRKLGIDGPQALGLLSQGLKAGARDSDLVADSLKEFAIRAVDGSKTTVAGFKSLGLNATKMGDQIAKGGKGASDGLQTVLAKLRGIKDPVKRAAIATELFGTQSEDLGAALFALNPATATAGAGIKKLNGSTDRMTDAIGSTANPLETLKRSIMGTVTSLASGLIPVIGPVTGFITRFGPAVLATAGAVGALVLATSAYNAVLGVQAVLAGEATAATVLQKTVMFAVAVATKAQAAATWLLNAALAANPIGLVVLAIAALVAAFVVAWKHSETFRNIVKGVWAGIKMYFQVGWAVIKAVFEGIKTGIGVVWSVMKSIGGAIAGVARGIGSAFVDGWHAIRTVYGWIKSGINGVKNFIEGIAGSLWGGLTSGLSAAWDFIKGIIDDIIGAVQKAIDFLASTSGKGTFEGGGPLSRLSGESGGGSSGGTSHPGRALGGPVTAGVPYVVGEHRPELFVPDTNGRIIPRVPAGGSDNSELVKEIRALRTVMEGNPSAFADALNGVARNANRRGATAPAGRSW